MTYIYAFNLEPDGTGVVSDTRLTYGSSPSDLRVDTEQVAKVYQVGRLAFIAVAGRIDHVAKILEGLVGALKRVPASSWYDTFVTHCDERLAVCIQDQVFSASNPPEFQLIYSDLRHKRGRSRCRLIRIEPRLFNGQLRNARTVAKMGEYVAIGWSEEGRRALNHVASDSLAEIEGRGLEITEPTRQEIQALGHHPPDSKGIQLDSRGPRDGSFRETLRKYSAGKFLKGEHIVAFEPVLLYGGVAKAAIASKTEELRLIGLEGVECVGTQWTISTLTLRHGIREFDKDNVVPLTPLVTALRQLHF